MEFLISLLNPVEALYKYCIIVTLQCGIALSGKLTISVFVIVIVPCKRKHSHGSILLCFENVLPQRDDQSG